eukprot:scaffold47260_cov28-Tisochrysis_lutea.AAC.5
MRHPVEQEVGHRARAERKHHRLHLPAAHAAPRPIGRWSVEPQLREEPRTRLAALAPLRTPYQCLVLAEAGDLVRQPQRCLSGLRSMR